MAAIPFLDLAQSNAPYIDEIEQAVLKTIRAGRFLHGPETAAFERELALSCGAGFAVAVSNGLDAIRLILRAYLESGRLKKGDSVMVAANTYIATVLPISEFGLRPIFVEPDPDTMNFSWRNAESLLHDLDKGVPTPDDLRPSDLTLDSSPLTLDLTLDSSPLTLDLTLDSSPLTLDLTLDSSPLTLKISAAIITHLYGTPCWDADIAAEFRRRGILIIEDNAQAIGAVAPQPGFNGSRVTGALGDAAAFSFYPTKNIGALGDAGAVATSDPLLADAVRALANYGSDRRYHNIYRGYNCRMDEIQAAALRVKLRHLGEENNRRQRIAEIYDREISNPIVTKPRIFPDAAQVWHQYVVLLPPDLRDSFREYLASKEIGSDIHYPDPPCLQPCYEEYSALASPDHTSVRLARSCVSIPIANVSPAEAMTVARAINDFNPDDYQYTKENFPKEY